MIIKVKAGGKEEIIKVCHTFDEVDSNCKSVPKEIGKVEYTCNGAVITALI